MVQAGRSGEVQLNLLEFELAWQGVFAGDTLSIGLLRKASLVISGSDKVQPRSHTQGFFTKSRNGRVTYDRVVLNRSLPSLRIRAERISTEAYPEG